MTPSRPQSPTTPRATVYKFGETVKHDANVVALTLGNHAIAQISALNDGKGDGFLIRVWPQNGTAEHGGSNITALSLVIRTTDGAMRLGHIDFSDYAKAREESEAIDR